MTSRKIEIMGISNSSLVWGSRLLQQKKLRSRRCQPLPVRSDSRCATISPYVWKSFWDLCTVSDLRVLLLYYRLQRVSTSSFRAVVVRDFLCRSKLYPARHPPFSEQYLFVFRYLVSATLDVLDQHTSSFRSLVAY